MLKARDKGIVLWTLRFGDEVHDPGDYFSSIGEAKPDPKLMCLIGELIESRRKAWSPEMAADPVQARLLDIIAAKKKGATRKPRPAAESAIPAIWAPAARSPANPSARSGTSWRPPKPKVSSTLNMSR